MGNVKLPIFFCLFFVLSCEQPAINEIELFDGHQYQLLSGEKLVGKTQDDVNLANTLKTLVEKPELILYKKINHPDYTTYLFIDLDTIASTQNTYLKIPTGDGSQITFYQHLVDPASEVTSITKLEDFETYGARFSQDSLSSQRFTIASRDE